MDDEEMTLYCICKSPDIDRFMIMCDQCEEWYHGDCINITEKDSRKIKYFYCKWCRRKDPSLKIFYRKSKRSHSEKESKKVKKAKKSRVEDRPQQIKKKRASESEKAKVKRELKNDELKKTAVEDVTKVKSETEKRPSTSDVKDADVDRILAIAVDTVDIKKSREEKPERKCGKCANCLRRDNCLRCETCLNHGNSARTTCLQKRCLLIDAQVPVKREMSYPPKMKIKKEYSNYELGEDLAELRNFDISHILSQTEQKPHSRRGNRGQQCYGPGCTHTARTKSKYCSDECGKRLAAKRLNLIMPSRVHAWHNTPTVANEVGSAELERIRSVMTQARTELQAMEAKFQRLESIIARSKTFPISEGSSDAEDNDESDQSVFCVVCGHPVALKSAIKHMDRCYIKIEAQISFGSVYPTRIEGSERLFCDVYNRQQQTYCKRLQVICPEHAKEPKIGPNEVCGCPLKDDIYVGEEPTKASQFCSRVKRKCNKHFKWESMYRASVDLQRIRQWLKIDEIFEEERRIRNAMVSRAGVIPLLLHQTTAHDPDCLDMRTKPSNLKRPAYRLVI